MTNTKAENKPKKQRNSKFKRIIRYLIKKYYKPKEDDSAKSKIYKRAEHKKSRIIISLTIVFLLIIMMFTPVFQIKEIKVLNNVRVDTETVLKVSGISEGDNIFRINKIKANRQLEKMPFVESVKIKRHIPSKIEIILNENTECAFIKFMGNYIGIDMNGKILEILQSDDGIELPVVTGISLKSFTIGKKTAFNDSGDDKIMFELLEHLKTNEIAQYVKAINFKKDGKLQLTLKDKTKVELGDSKKLKYKTAYLKAILAELGDTAGGVIELSDTDNVSYRGASE